MNNIKAAFLASFLIPLALTAQPSSWKNILHEIQQKYAPDHRTAVFSVTGNDTSGSIELHGEVDNPSAKKALRTRASKSGSMAQLLP